ncbi:MAG: four helix bundle protein [Candidatus Yanofskybacteria bacterium]|nr:four helix bundle protein [Candidatus Yanofskybacteria bacterium]
MQNENVNFKMQFNKRLIDFSLAIIKLCGEVRKSRNLWAIADQLIRSATSVGANVFEARAASSKLDYLKFFQIALKSSNETKYWLILLIESTPNLRNQINPLLKEAEEISKIIGAGVLTMKGRK